MINIAQKRGAFSLEESSKCKKNFNIAKTVFDINFSCVVSILDIIANDFEDRKDGIITVSYTHLTLPTKRIV